MRTRWVEGNVSEDCYTTQQHRSTKVGQLDCEILLSHRAIVQASRDRVDLVVGRAFWRLDPRCAWMDLDNSVQRPLHWGHIILPDDEDRAFFDAVVSLAQFIATGQLIQVFPMLAILEMLF